MMTNTPQRQQGSTLLEILVSVFILGFGLLALVSMQMKTVMTAREAENQTIVAQAADSLIEGMVLNPKLKLFTSGDTQLAQRDFTDYTGAFTAIKNQKGECDDDETLTAAAASSTVTVTQANLAKSQICTFTKRLYQIQGLSNPNLALSTDSGTTTLTVTWEQTAEDEDAYKDTDLVNDNNAIEYTYQAVIGQ